MSDLESEIAAQLRRRTEALSIDGQVHGRLVRRVRARQRRRRAALLGGPIGAVVVAALAAALIVPSAGHPSRLRASAASPTHGAPKAAVPKQPSASFASPDSPSLAPGVGDLRWVDFVTPERGWALADVQGHMRIARTSDGGLSWAVVGAALPARAGGPTPTRLVVVHARNGRGANVTGLYAYAGADPLGGGGAGRLFVSLDQGSSWQVVGFPGPVLGVAPPPGPGGSTSSPPARDGELWALIGPPAQGGPSRPVRLEVSADAGRTWKSAAAMPGAGDIGAVARISQRGGLVVSERDAGGLPGSSLFETTDGGASWQRLTDPCGSFPDQQLSAVTTNHLWLACGSQPAGTLQAKAVYVSTNGARTWHQTASVGLATTTSIGSLGRSGAIVGLAAVSGQRAWLALDRGPVEATTDRGRTWQPAFSLPSGSGGVVQVAFVDATHGWALTPHGLWRTSDGVRWQRLGG